MLMGGVCPQCRVGPLHTPAVYLGKQHCVFGNIWAGKSAVPPEGVVCSESRWPGRGPGRLGLTFTGVGEAGADRWSPLLSTCIDNCPVTVPEIQRKPVS